MQNVVSLNVESRHKRHRNAYKSDPLDLQSLCIFPPLSLCNAYKVTHSTFSLRVSFHVLHHSTRRTAIIAVVSHLSHNAYKVTHSTFSLRVSFHVSHRYHRCCLIYHDCDIINQQKYVNVNWTMVCLPLYPIFPDKFYYISTAILERLSNQ